MSYFCVFESNNWKLEKGGLEIKISTRMKTFHFWVKYTVFIKNENDFFLILIFCTHGLMTIFNKRSKSYNDLINIIVDKTS